MLIAMGKQSGRHASSKLHRQLETAWSKLQAVDSRIPDVVITTLTAGELRRKLGHATAKHWRGNKDVRHEIAVHPGHLRNPEELLETMVHEAAHAILQEESGGCRPGSQYHRTRFRDVAHELGLECVFRDTRYGWSITRWPTDGVPKRYRKVLTYLSRIKPIHTSRLPKQRRRPEGRATPKSGLKPLVCGCSPPLRIHAGNRVIDGAGVRCVECGDLFKPAS